jgi:spore coat polysaccharide biosynthesis protein SpsF
MRREAGINDRSMYSAPGSLRAIVQARMSSRRFPGKVLAPFRGRPLIDHVTAAVRLALPGVPVVVATSTEHSDDPLALYLGSTGMAVYRGPLDDVFGRFRGCIQASPTDYVLRICADSPLVDGGMLRKVVSSLEGAEGASIDVASTTIRRTFPKGHNAELIRTASLLAIDVAELNAHDREHVTPFFYRHPQRFRLLSVESGDPDLASTNLSVDTVEDLHRLEALTSAGPSSNARQ